MTPFEKWWRNSTPFYPLETGLDEIYTHFLASSLSFNVTVVYVSPGTQRKAMFGELSYYPCLDSNQDSS